MDIREMQYDFKQKLNKIDSQQYRNLRIPEIDWKLNEAVDVYIKNIAEPRKYTHLGFETSQRTIDDIRTLVVNNENITASPISDKEYFISLPQNYMFYLSSESKISKESCGTITAKTNLRQHDDRHETSTFDKSSFEWRETNIRFYEEGIKIFSDGTFTVEGLCLNYIKKHPYIHNAQDFGSGTYNLHSGASLTGSQDCILPEHTHREIVDIAVLIATGDLQIPDYKIKQAKLNLNQIN